MINGDTMISNSMGGILLGQSNGSCPTEIKNCNFISNGYHGAIYDSLTYSKINIHDNYFLTNGSIWGIITFYNTLSSGRIENNYFDTNSCYDYIISSGGGNSVVIKKNYFINNTSLDGGIIGFESLTNDTISCNTLLNNHTYKAAINLSTYVYSSNGVIQHNIIDGNICNTNNETGIFNAIQAPTGVLDFSNNMVRNNSTGTGRLCHIVAYLNDSTEQLKIYHNEFKNNTSNIILFFAGPLINNSGLDFMYFKHNNFLDASNEYTLYDSIPYGSPNILADSNYWGSTSTQHVDSVIYDYFDFAAQSVVYYLPISEVANSIDTVCRVPCFVSAAVLNNASCNGANNGAAIVTSSGTPPFNYAWSPSGGSGATATNLAAGTYTCYITDSVSCTTWTTVHITQPPGLNVYLDQPNNVLCYGGNSGCADVYVYNGTPPYTYNWSPSGGTGATACNLTANTYTVSITEANGCLTTDTITITQPPQLTANTSTLNNVSCFNGNNGRASVTAGGGTPAYAYHWSPSGGNSITANNLIATTYTVTVTDAHACSITSTATVTQPPVITETITVTNASCSACSDGSAYVNVGGGMAPYTYLWTPSGGNGATASNLLPGSYTCCITDANGCTKCQSDSVSYPLAVNEISHTQTGLTIIPNPAHNSFTISLNNQSSLNNSQLTIFDVTGRVVHEQKIQSQLSTVNCQLSAGVYFVKVSDGERVYEQKLVVE
jgi:hypothetical protein